MDNAVMATRRVLSWRLSITMEAAFCVETLENALARHGKPDIFNTDQGSQFTGVAFTGVLVGCRDPLPQVEINLVKKHSLTTAIHWAQGIIVGQLASIALKQSGYVGALERRGRSCGLGDRVGAGRREHLRIAVGAPCRRRA
jgi:hypothetical protein